MPPPLIIPADLETIAWILSRSVVPLGLTFLDNALPWEETKRGTATLLKLRGRHVFATCCHIWEALQEMELESPTARVVGYLIGRKELCVLNGFTLIDKERRSLDVAILGGQENEIFLPGMRFIDYETSYISDPQPGELVMIVGYPGENVQVTETKADFGYTIIGFRASSVSERQIKLVHEFGDRRFFDYDDPKRAGICLGGLSGSAAYVVRDNVPRFVGIVTECSLAEKMIDQTIIVSRLGCLNPDGTLDHTAIAW